MPKVVRLPQSWQVHVEAGVNCGMFLMQAHVPAHAWSVEICIAGPEGGADVGTPLARTVRCKSFGRSAWGGARTRHF
jgi:hypothetical protein